MKRILLAMIAAVALLAVGGSSAFAASAGFNVSVTVRQAITVTWQQDLNFGTVEAANTTYTVNANSGAQTQAGVGAVPALFTINGDTASAGVQVSFASNPVTAACQTGTGTCVAGTDTLTVTLVTESGTDPDTTSITSFSGTPVNYYVGGTVPVTSTTPSGLYTTAATLNVIYQ